MYALADIQKFVWREVASYRGVVKDVEVEGDPDAVQVVFKDRAGEEFSRIFPRKRLEEIMAAFRGAQVCYTMYDAGRTEEGSVRLSVMRKIGPKPEDIVSVPINWPTEEELQDHDGEI